MRFEVEKLIDAYEKCEAGNECEKCPFYKFCTDGTFDLTKQLYIALREIKKNESKKEVYKISANNTHTFVKLTTEQANALEWLLNDFNESFEEETVLSDMCLEKVCVKDI